MDAVVFVYDVNNLGTLMSLDGWVEEVEDHGVRPDIPRVLVGNKCDEVLDNEDAGDIVTTSVAQRWADDRNMPLFEVRVPICEMLN